MATKKILITIGAVVLLSTTPYCFSQNKQTADSPEFTWEMKLSNRLIEYKSIDLKDLAIVQLTRLKTKYPTQKDLINLTLAKCLQLSRQYKTFDKTIALIPTDSIYKDEVTLLKASQFSLLGKTDQSLGEYKKFFTLNASVPSDASKLNQWSSAASLYAAILNKTGKKADADLAIEMIAKIAEASKKSGNRSGFRVNVLKQCRLAIGAIQAGSITDAKLKATKLKELAKQLQQNAFSNDFIAMDSYFEIAKIKLIEKNYKGVVVLMKDVGHLMVQLESALKEQNADIKYSPIPGGFYFYGEAYRSLAEQLVSKNSNDKAVKAYTLAIKKFSQAIELYPQSPYAATSLASLSKIGRKLADINLPEKVIEKYGKYLSGFGVHASVSYKNAMSLYADGNYEGAAEGFKTALSTSLTDETTPKTLYFLIQALLKSGKVVFSNTGKCWEIEAIADILTSDFASTDEAANICATLGSRYAAQSKATKENKETSKNLLDTSMYWYDEFVNLRPRDEKAATYKFSIAENIRGKGIAFEKMISTCKDEVEISRLRHEQQKVLYLAITRYEYLINTYGNIKFGKEANKSLANVYYMLKKYEKSATIYLAYAESLDDPKKQVEIYRLACMAYMKSKTPAKAVAVFDKLIAVIESNKLVDADSKKKLLDAYSLRAWAYDLASDKDTSTLKTLKSNTLANKQQISKSKSQIRLDKKQLTTATELQELKKKEFAEMITYIESGLPRNTKVGKQKVVEGETEAERRKRAEQKIAKDKRLALASLKQRKNRLTGENVQLRTTEQELKAVAKEYEKLANSASQALSKLKNATKGNESKVKVIDFDIAQLLQKQKRAKKTLETVEKELEALEIKNKANKNLLKSPIEKERLAAKIEQLELSRFIKKARKLFAVSFSKKQNADIAKELDTKKLNERKALLIEASTLNAQAIKQAESDLALIEMKKTSIGQNLKMVKFGLVKNRLETKNFGKKDKKTTAAIQLKTAEYLDLTKTSQSFEQKAIALEIHILKDRIKALKDTITKLNAANDNITKDIEKVTIQLGLIKRKTLGALKEYFTKYNKKTDHRALNLAKAGSTLIYFKEFEEAAEYLKSLKKDYPGHKLVESTTYSLANAYLEIGKYAEAQKIFSEKLKKKGSLTTNQIYRIQKGTFALAETAEKDDMKILLAISNQAGLKFQAMTLKDKSSRTKREQSLFMLGKGAYLNKAYAKAIGNFEQIIRKNPRTGLIFKLKLMQGICYREQPQADLKSAERSFYDIIQYGEDRVGRKTFFQAQLELAKTKVAKKTVKDANTAANLLDVLAYGIDTENSDMFDMYEDVLYNAAQYFSLGGNQKKAQEKVKRYLALFPKGKYTQKIKKLPPALTAKNKKNKSKK